MKRIKNITAVLVIMALVIFTAGAFKSDAAGNHNSLGKWAQQGSDSGTLSGNNMPAAGHEISSQVVSLMIHLNLTDAQKKEIADILKKYQESIKSDVNAVLEARKNLFDAIHADTYDENAVRATSRNAASAEEELAVLRAKIVSEIKAVLTPEQLAIIKQFEEDIFAKIKNKVETIQYLVQLWIDKNS